MRVLHPDSPRTLIASAAVALLKKDHQAATAFCEEARAKISVTDDWQVFANLISVVVAIPGQRGRAVELLEYALEAREKFSWAYLVLGHLLFADDPDRAGELIAKGREYWDWTAPELERFEGTLRKIYNVQV